MRAFLAGQEKNNMAGILDRKVALVTGGASGIGRATALAMAREGARVAVADRTEENAAATVALITAAGGQAIAIGGDVALEADVAAMVAGHCRRLWADRLCVQQCRRCRRIRWSGRPAPARTQ